MRIPLDYYRILSVPVKATSQQLEQAYGDRLLQQPRREYNEQAILARQELIQQAYGVLSDSQQRASYDAQFLVNMQPVVAESPEVNETGETGETVTITENLLSTPPLANPTIEIPSSQLVGALLILHELGEYELVLKLGIDYFNSQEFSELLEQQGEETNETIRIIGSVNAVQANIILSLALAYLELGREQWHRQEYENAALSCQMGLDLLNQENLFPLLKEELELDLYKLRPYRVLEFIAQNPANSSERARGFQLLREMLLQRQGIEGKGEDRSGLSFDQFLCFIQQLRTYLTSAEQQKLFDSEAQKDSAIANYLAVYALLARGFSLKQPELVLRAQRKLDSLSDRQDVAWEQIICALLLGHTEKAIKKLQNSEEKTKLEQIRLHSASSTDLLPGMCFYGEQWLQEEVVTQFSDLGTTQVTLKEYFADRQVQTYLEELASTTAFPVAQTAKIRPPQEQGYTTKSSESQETGRGIMSRWRNIFSTEKTAPAKVASSNQFAQSERELVSPGVVATAQDTATLEGHNHNVISHTGIKSKYRQKAPQNTENSPIAKSKSLSLPLQTRAKTRAVPTSVMQRAKGQGKPKRARRVSRKKKLNPATFWKGWLFILSLILGVGTIGFITTKLFLDPAYRTAKRSHLAIAVAQPAIEVPTVKTKPVVTKPKVKKSEKVIPQTFADKSQQVVQKWLSSKSAAFGKKHQIKQLNNILAEPLLGTWRDRAVAYQEGDFYREYEHKIKMRSATIDPNDPNKATVEAEVKENANHYQSGQLDQTQSYNDNLLVRYELVRQGEKWLIQSSEVVETL